MVDDLRRNFIMNPENGLKVVLSVVLFISCAVMVVVDNDV